jgi:SAM-dependent methyltransferase
MKPVEYETMYIQESDHWWFAGKRHLVHMLLNRSGIVDKVGSHKLRLLDIGCGTGRNIQELSQYGEVVGCDFSPDALTFCKKRGLDNLVQASAEALPFSAEKFDVICLLDVLYHRGIASDEQVLAQVYQALNNGGALIITDSAFQFLFGHHDRAAHGLRRYERQELKDKLLKAGFQVEQCGYANFLIFFPAFLIRMIKNRLPHTPDVTDISPAHPWINTFFKNILYLEHWFMKLSPLPFGLSVFAVARKN